MSVAASAEDRLLHDFAADESKASVTGPLWLDVRRARALRSFRAQGVPHRRVEDWKYTDLRGAVEAGAGERPDHAASAANVLFPSVPGVRLRIIDGSLMPESPQSTPAGIEVVDLASLDETAPGWIRTHLGQLRADAPMNAASLAFMHGGVALRVTGTPIEPVHLQIEGAAAASRHARVLLVLEPGTSLTLAQSVLGSAALANIGIEIVLGDDAQLTHVRLAGHAPDSVRVEQITVSAGRGAQYRAALFELGARLSRLELSLSLDGEGAEAGLAGATILSDDLHGDVTTRIDHAVGRTTSRQLFKNVAGGRARAVYQGKISVRKGAAIGDLDADSLFYLRSRGLPETEARTLLLKGFLQEIMQEIDREDLRASTWNILEAGLAAAVETVS